MKRCLSLFLCFLLLATLSALTACGQKPSSSEGSGVTGQPTKPGQSSETEQVSSVPDIVKVAVVDAISEEGTYYPEEVYTYAYSYHIPEIQLDAPGAATINEEILRMYTDRVQNALQAQEVPECNAICYEYHQTGNVLSLVIICEYGWGGLEDYIVYHYDIAQDAILQQDDLLALLGVSDEALQNAITQAAAQKFDETYYDDPYYAAEIWQQDPSRYLYYRADTLGGYYLDNALVYLGEGGQPRVFLPYWTFAGAGVAFCDLPLTLTPGKAGKLEDELLDVNWDNTEVTIRFHGGEDNRDFWGERFGCGWLLAYDQDLPVAGLYSRYTQAILHMTSLADPPILFLLTDRGRVEYVDLVSCMRGGYLCGGGPLIGVENVKRFTLEQAPGYGGAAVFAQCADGSKVDLADALAESRQALPEDLAGSWETAIPYRWESGETAEVPCTLTLHEDGWIELLTDSEYMYKSTLNLLGVTEDGVVCQYRLYPDAYLEEADGVPYCGTVAFRAEYDQDAWEEVLYVTTLGVDVVGILDDTPGAITRMTRSDGDRMPGGAGPVGPGPVSARYLEAADGAVAYQVTLSDDEYATSVLFTTEKPVTNFTLLELSLQEMTEDGKPIFSATPLEVDGLPQVMTAETPIAVQMTFFGDLPGYGFSYVDDNGYGRRIALLQSGYDGSIILNEANPQEADFVLSGAAG